MRDNVSHTKPFSVDVAAAFASPEAHALRDRLLTSEYARQFRYDSRVPEAQAAE